jgi:phosphotransferase system HPr (HPr) family protein
MPASSETVVVLSRDLHARPAGQVSQLAARYPDTAIELVAGERRANARSVLAVMALGAVAGTEVRILGTGPEASAVADAVVEILLRGDA